MFDLTLLSIFRKSEEYLPRYLKQVEEAFRLNGGHCHAIWLEGDSEDRTFEMLENAKKELEKKGHQVTLIKYDLGGNYWPSQNISERWQQLAACWNHCMEYLLPSHYTICVESDLIWDPEVIGKLMQKLDPEHPVIFPMLLINNSERIFGSPWFYDIWGFERANKKFNNTWPYWEHSDELLEEQELLEITTGGGMIVSTYGSQKQGKWDPACCIMKFPKKLKIFMDKTIKIYHPEPLQWQNFSRFAIFLKKTKASFRKYSHLILKKR